MQIIWYLTNYLPQSNMVLSQKDHVLYTASYTALNDWSESLDKRHSVDIIYIDFSKAFDVVLHVRLTAKLKAYGIDGNLLKWIESYLVGRKQCVVVNGHSSSWSIINSGVPQGSVLGPLLFNLYVSDIPSLVSSPILFFGDDTKIYRSIHSKEVFCSYRMMILYYWNGLNYAWQLKFNISKCSLLHLGKPHEYGQYQLNSVPIFLNWILLRT